MKKNLLFTILTTVLGIFSSYFNVNCQVYKFQRYGVERGIYPFIYSVNQDKTGFIWVSSGTGLYRFDGFTFTHKLTQTDLLPESSVEVSFKDKNNNLWFGHSDGTIVFSDGIKTKIIKSENSQGGKITGIVADRKGNVLVAMQNSGLMIIDTVFNKTYYKELFQGKLIYALSITSNNELLVATSEGILVYAYDSDAKKIYFLKKIDNLPESKVNSINNSLRINSFWICTEDSGVFILTQNGKANYKVENFSPAASLENENIQSVFEDSKSHIWISTMGKGLFELKLNQSGEISEIINFNEINGLETNDIKNTYEDNEGNIWISTYGKGIALLLNESFIYYDLKKNIVKNNILSVCFDKDGYWLGGENALVKVNLPGNTTQVYTTSSGLPIDAVTSLFLDSAEVLWIGTGKNGIYQMLPKKDKIISFYKADNSLGNSINSITGKGSKIYIGTKNGIYIYNQQTKNWKNVSTSEGLPHNDIHQLFIGPKGNIWVATHSSTLFALNNNLRFNIKGGVEMEFSCITADNAGNIWAGTNGNGIFQFVKDTFFYYSTRNGGLKSDYCYALTSDKFGNIWVGHRLGLSKINNITHKIKTYGTDYITGDVNSNAIAQDAEGNILMGTTNGLILNEWAKNKVKAPSPKLNITSIIINDSIYDVSKKITLPYGNYRVSIDFIGLNYNNPDQVTYQYKLEGFDIDSVWPEASTIRQAKYQRLSDGSYTFMVKACNGDGICADNPLTLEIKIKRPYWKTWWFISISIVALIISVYLIIIIRERKQKTFQLYLEKLLDERTREVREQKEEIEIKNRDITDSINYAQRIQASILPSLRKLQHIFSGSFVYYLPKNIVSGDFYWFEVIPNTNKFLIVCADSTGHGVPGAFMSIIGTTLLKDIFSRPEVRKPSDILMHLDNELKSTLNQDTEGERPNDGMDIIVCEIDIKTYYARFSSAMRPFIVYKNGEQLYFKGSKSSIGGQVREAKIFEDVELQLTKGDLVYMFSDGYPDQFGGPLGKKFKMVRLRNLLKDIYQKPMEEQYNYVKSNFELWQGDNDQVDDILFMGIKI